MSLKETALQSQVSRGVRLFCVARPPWLNKVWFVAVISEAGGCVQLNIVLWLVTPKCRPRAVGRHPPYSSADKDLIMSRKEWWFSYCHYASYGSWMYCFTSCFVTEVSYLVWPQTARCFEWLKTLYIRGIPRPGNITYKNTMAICFWLMWQQKKQRKMSKFRFRLTLSKNISSIFLDRRHTCKFQTSPHCQ